MQKLEREDIVSILKNEHDVVRGNFKKILATDPPIRDVYSATADAILNHFNGEEKLVFPALESNKDSLKVVYALFEEHGIVRKQISELSSLTAVSEDNRWFAKALVLDAILKSHFELEENQVFPKAENLLTAEQREEVGQRYKNKQF